MLSKKQTGFTIVELLIVIVVIGILAAITIVAYNGIQQRARTSTLQSDLSNAASQMHLAKVDSTNDSYPTSLPSGTKASQGVILQLAQTGNANTFCINAYIPSPYTVASFDSSSSQMRNYLCSGATTGSAVGGTTPAAPRGVNLVADVSTWTMSGGVSYNSSTNELVFNGAGDATSPLIRIDEPTSAALKVESFATTASPSQTPNSGVYFSSFYYGSDGTTPATNSIG
jgi:prepilin-type N-terminal cleavage/methylation domain-containing protein